MDIFWLVVGGGGYTLAGSEFLANIGGSWWVVVDIFWLVVGGGGHILAGGRWWGIVVGEGGYILAGGGWWWTYFGWWWVVVDIFWMVVGGGVSWWIVMDDGWQFSLTHFISKAFFVFEKSNFNFSGVKHDAIKCPSMKHKMHFTE